MLQWTRKSNKINFTRKGMQVFFAVALVATFLLAIPNTAKATNFNINYGKDYLTNRGQNFITFNQAQSQHWVGWNNQNKQDQVRAAQSCVILFRTFTGYKDFPDLMLYGGIDGIYGSATYAGLYGVQSHVANLTNDGCAGPATWGFLGDWVYSHYYDYHPPAGAGYLLDAGYVSLKN